MGTGGGPGPRAGGSCPSPMLRQTGGPSPGAQADPPRKSFPPPALAAVLSGPAGLGGQATHRGTCVSDSKPTRTLPLQPLPSSRPPSAQSWRPNSNHERH